MVAQWTCASQSVVEDGQLVFIWTIKRQHEIGVSNIMLILDQSIISSNSIQNITQLQQMGSKEEPSLLTSLLGRIRLLLKEWTLRNTKEAPGMQAQITALTEQLHAANLTPQRIIGWMVHNEAGEHRLRAALWEQLRKGRQQEDLLRTWQELKEQTRQNYSISESSLNTLVKEILENIKLISEELQHLTHNLQTLRNDTASPSLDSSPPQIPLYFLIKMAMEDSAVTFSEAINELLFRLYILEESTTLILLKTLRVFEELSERLNDEAASRRSSLNSQRSGKRSALSESLEVFKRNQLRQELERSDLLLPLQGLKETQIQSDYKMTRHAEKRTGKADNRTTCCFRF